MTHLRVVLLWAASLWLQLVVAPLLRWLQGYPDVTFLTWLAVGLFLRGRGFWVWTLLWGFATGWVSALPDVAVLVAYVGLGFLLERIRERLWERPYLLLFGGTLVGTMALRLWEYGVVQFIGAEIPWVEALRQVLIPSLWWNLLLALPVYTVVSGFTGPRRTET